MIHVVDLAALMTAPALLILDGEAPAPALPLPIWRMRRTTDGWLLSQAEGEAQPLLAAPAGVLGVLAAQSPEWLAHWPAPETPPILPDAAACAAMLVGEWLAANQRNAALRAELVALRAEHEDARQAMAHWQRSMGQAPPAAAQLLHADDPRGGAALSPGRTQFDRILPVPLDGACTLGLHLREALCGAGSCLRLRLLGAESMRIAAAWRIPGAALLPGWLMLDLPMPAPIWGETAMVEITAELAPGDTLALSAPDAALRLLRAKGAPRFAVSPFHDATEAGGALPPAGLRCALPAMIWRGQQRHARLAPGEAAELALPAVPLAGFDTLHAVLTAVGGAVQASLWCAEAGSGWRDARDGALDLPLVLPAAASGSPAVRLALRATGTQPVAVEWRALTAARMAALELR